MQKFYLLLITSASHCGLPPCLQIEGQAIAKATVDTLLLLRTDSSFEAFWSSVMELQQSNDMLEPHLPRKRKVPARLQEGTGAPSFPAPVEAYNCPVYFAAVDTVVQTIRQRFDQEGYCKYRNLEDLLLKGCAGQDYSTELTAIASLYKDDIQTDLVHDQLQVLHAHCVAEGDGAPTMLSVVSYMQSLSSRQCFLSEVCVLLQLLLISPATNATSEHSFSLHIYWHTQRHRQQ